jgi:hypothetical protein
MSHTKAWSIVLTAAWLICCPGCSDDAGGSTSQNQPPIAIEPRVSVGKIHTGMTEDQVLAELGKPDRRTPRTLEYTRLGFAVMPNSNKVIEIVLCGDVTGIDGPLVKAFNGRTKEGIGMNSTREEVVKALGEPTSSEKFIAGIESLQYVNQGITLTLERSKVHHMIVRLGQPETDRTVNLVPPAKN